MGVPGPAFSKVFAPGKTRVNSTYGCCLLPAGWGRVPVAGPFILTSLLNSKFESVWKGEYQGLDYRMYTYTNYEFRISKACGSARSRS